MSTEEPIDFSDDPWAQTYRDCGYDYCRPCNEWHRPPECPIDEQGRPLDPSGTPWVLSE